MEDIYPAVTILAIGYALGMTVAWIMMRAMATPPPPVTVIERDDRNGIGCGIPMVAVIAAAVYIAIYLAVRA